MLDYRRIEQYRENNLMLVLDEFDLSTLDMDSVRRYRLRMQSHRPGHVWEELDDADFLYKLGAVGRGEGGKLHPTAAGLMMFGYEYEITRYFPAYFLDYQERLEDDTRWTDRIVSSSGDWSGNLYDFYFRVYHRLQQEVKVPFRVENGERVDETPVHTALREALANCLINADYYGSRGVVVIRRKAQITLSNPGSFRIPLEEAQSGGLSDPRNTALMKMFNLINIGERAGSGIPSIYSVWRRQGWAEPTLAEALSPERTTLTLPLMTVEKATIKSDDNGFIDEKAAVKSGDNEVTPKISDKKSATKNSDKISAVKISGKISAHHKEQILEHLTAHISATTAELAELLGLKPPRVRQLLSELQKEDLIVAEGAFRNRAYKLKA